MSSKPELIKYSFDERPFSLHKSCADVDFRLLPELSEADELLMQITDKNAVHDRQFKASRRRNVFSFKNFLVKKYTFNTLIDTLHSWRYAPREIADFQQYAKRFAPVDGVRLPKLLGFFQRKKYLFFFAANGLIMEYLPDTRFLKSEELPLAAPVFANHYRCDIYHPDMQYCNIMIQERTQSISPIDYIGCNFLAEPNLDSLLLQLARFCQTANAAEHDEQKLLEETLKQLPELKLNIEKSWQVLTKLKARHLTTHQHNNVLQLPPELKTMLSLKIK